MAAWIAGSRSAAVKRRRVMGRRRLAGQVDRVLGRAERRRDGAEDLPQALESSCSATPYFSQASVAATPAPPPLVTMTVLPRGRRGRAARNLHQASASWRCSARSTPHWRMISSKTSSEPASEPVCEAAAIAPRRERPDLITTTGLHARRRLQRADQPLALFHALDVHEDDLRCAGRRAGTRADRPRRCRPCCRPRRSPRGRSPSTAVLPIIAPPIAPLWVMMATLPGRISPGPKPAVERGARPTKRPKMFGPRMRMPCSRAIRDEPALLLHVADLREAGGDHDQEARPRRGRTPPPPRARAARGSRCRRRRSGPADVDRRCARPSPGDLARPRHRQAQDLAALRVDRVDRPARRRARFCDDLASRSCPARARRRSRRRPRGSKRNRMSGGGAVTCCAPRRGRA